MLLVVLLLCRSGMTAEGSLMDQWRQWVQPDLKETGARLRELMAEQAALPEADSLPDFSQPGYRSLPAAQPETEKWVQIDLGRVQPIDDIVLIPAVLPSPSGAAAAVGFPARFRVELSVGPGFASPGGAADFTGADFPDPGPMPVVVGNVGREARYVRVTAVKLRGEPDNYFFALGELVICSGNRNIAQGSGLEALDVFDSPRWSLQGLTDMKSAAGRPVEQRSLPTNGYHGREESLAGVPQWVQVDLGRVLPLDEVRLVPARPVNFADTIGFGFPLRFTVEGSDDAAFTQPQRIADYSAADFPNPGDRRVVLPAQGLAVRYVRVTAGKLWPRYPDKAFVFALAEMEVISRGINVARERSVTESAPLGQGDELWAPQYLVDGIAPREGVGTYAQWLSGLARRHAIGAETASLTARAVSLREAAETRLAWGACAGAAVLATAGMGMAWLSRVRQRRQTLELRARIARDLHDEIGSNLSSIALLSQLGIEAGPDAAAAQAELEEIRRVAAQTADSMHDIVWLISPGTKTAGDLASRLRATAGLLLAGLEWSVEVEGLTAGSRLPIATQRDLFLIYKEALHNILRHSGARRVVVVLSQSGRVLTLRISDDGHGFDPATVGRGHGLENMQRRATACRGRFQLDSARPCGTVLTLTIPLKR